MIDIDALQAWVGRTESRRGDVPAVLANRMGALLDQEFEARAGQPLPAHWYPMLFGETVAQSQLGPDGHPLKGGFLPPVPLPRRMFAGRRVQFIKNLYIGEAVTKTSRIQAVVSKTGRSGQMCFVTLRHEIAGETGVSVIEEQDIVYREALSAERGKTAQAGIMPVTETELLPPLTVLPDPVMLFRYSAITFNSHRIHYDQPYAQRIEQYPGLVVNGGLTLLLMWDYAVKQGWTLTYSASRNCKPVFANRSLMIQAVSRKGEPWLLTRDEDGDIAVETRLTEARV